MWSLRWQSLFIAMISRARFEAIRLARAKKTCALRNCARNKLQPSAMNCGAPQSGTSAAPKLLFKPSQQSQRGLNSLFVGAACTSADRTPQRACMIRPAYPSPRLTALSSLPQLEQSCKQCIPSLSFRAISLGCDSLFLASQPHAVIMLKSRPPKMSHIGHSSIFFLGGRSRARDWARHCDHREHRSCRGSVKWVHRVGANAGFGSEQAGQKYRREGRELAPGCGTEPLCSRVQVLPAKQCRPLGVTRSILSS
jgi:hypothetical protein